MFKFGIFYFHCYGDTGIPGTGLKFILYSTQTIILPLCYVASLPQCMPTACLYFANLTPGCRPTVSVIVIIFVLVTIMIIAINFVINIFHPSSWGVLLFFSVYLIGLFIQKSCSFFFFQEGIWSICYLYVAAQFMYSLSLYYFCPCVHFLYFLPVW